MGDSIKTFGVRFLVVSTAFLVGAFRGGYLLGWQSGLMLGVFLAMAAFLIWDAFSSNDMIQRFVAVCFFALLLTFILVPTWLSSDIQYSIDRTANERKMRSELSDVFAADTRFSSLRMKFTRLKCTNIELSGTLPNSQSLDDARAALGAIAQLFARWLWFRGTCSFVTRVNKSVQVVVKWASRVLLETTPDNNALNRSVVYFWAG